MAKLSKKSKAEKISEIDKIKEYIEKYDTVAILQNEDVQNTCLQELRSSIQGKIVFGKKSLLQRVFPRVSYEENFFMVFTNATEIEKLQSAEYMSYLRVGEVAPVDVVIPSGVVRNKKLIGIVKPVENQGANTILLEDFTVVSKGEEIDAKSCEILKIRGERLIPRKFKIIDSFASKELLEASK